MPILILTAETGKSACPAGGSVALLWVEWATKTHEEEIQEVK